MHPPRKKIGRKGHKGGHDEPWIVSYADMMTLLFGFFVILYSMSTPDKKKISEFGEEVAKSMGKKEAPERISSVQLDLEKERELRAFEVLAGLLQLGRTPEAAVEAVENGSLSLKQREVAKDLLAESLVGVAGSAKPARAGDEPASFVDISFADGLLFDKGKATLRPEALPRIKDLAKAMMRVQSLVQIEVIGHTDSLRPAATSLYTTNWGLSSARAGSVAEALITAGVEPGRVLTRGLANTKPLYPEYRDNGEPIVENMSKNRRVEIIVRRQSAVQEVVHQEKTTH